MNELAEMEAAAIGHDMHVMADELKDQLKRTALEWGLFADRLDELELLHYELYTLCQRFRSLAAERGADHRRA